MFLPLTPKIDHILEIIMKFQLLKNLCMCMMHTLTHSGFDISYLWISFSDAHQLQFLVNIARPVCTAKVFLR